MSRRTGRKSECNWRGRLDGQASVCYPLFGMKRMSNKGWRNLGLVLLLALCVQAPVFSLFASESAVCGPVCCCCPSGETPASAPGVHADARCSCDVLPADHGPMPTVLTSCETTAAPRCVDFEAASVIPHPDGAQSSSAGLRCSPHILCSQTLVGWHARINC